MNTSRKSTKRKPTPYLRLVKPSNAPLVLPDEQLKVMSIRLKGSPDLDIALGELSVNLPEFGMLKGDIPVVIRDSPLKPGDLIVKERGNDEPGYITRYEAPALRLAGLNSKTPDLYDDFEIIGRVTHIIRAV